MLLYQRVDQFSTFASQQVIPGPSLSWEMNQLHERWEMNRWGITSFLEELQAEDEGPSQGAIPTLIFAVDIVDLKPFLPVAPALSTLVEPPNALCSDSTAVTLFFPVQEVFVCIFVQASLCFINYIVWGCFQLGTSQRRLCHAMPPLDVAATTNTLQLVATSRTTFWNHGESSQPWWIILWWGGWC